MFLKVRLIALIFLSLSVLLIDLTIAHAEVVAVLQAESMPIKTSGEISEGGTAWAINENGSISQPVTFAKGTHRLEVLARGTYVRGKWPVMQVRVDGAAVGAPVIVASSDWSIYSVEGNWLPGPGALVLN